MKNPMKKPADGGRGHPLACRRLGWTAETFASGAESTSMPQVLQLRMNGRLDGRRRERRATNWLIVIRKQRPPPRRKQRDRNLYSRKWASDGTSCREIGRQRQIYAGGGQAGGRCGHSGRRRGCRPPDGPQFPRRVGVDNIDAGGICGDVSSIKLESDMAAAPRWGIVGALNSGTITRTSARTGGVFFLFRGLRIEGRTGITAPAWSRRSRIVQDNRLWRRARTLITANAGLDAIYATGELRASVGAIRPAVGKPGPGRGQQGFGWDLPTRRSAASDQGPRSRR